jgi:hypothetical protein
MLNRTNLTLSALALSDRLNFGTRSLAANARVNDGVQNLRTRHFHHGIMRDGMVWQDLFVPRDAIPPIPSSISSVPQCQASCVSVQQGRFAVDVSVEPARMAYNVAGRSESRVQNQSNGSGMTSASRAAGGAEKTPISAARQLASALSTGSQRTAKRAARQQAFATFAMAEK